jgi:hypothetical protein
MVAGLGLTLPNGKQLESWWQSAQTWMNARLAELDARVSSEESEYVYFSDIATPRTETPPPLDAESKEAPAPTGPIVSKNSTPESPVSNHSSVRETPDELSVGLEAPIGPIAIIESELVEPVAEPTAVFRSASVTDADFEAAVYSMIAAFASELPAPVVVPPASALVSTEVSSEEGIDSDADLFGSEEPCTVRTPLVADAEFESALDEMITLFSAENRPGACLATEVVEADDDPFAGEWGRDSQIASSVVTSEEVKVTEQKESPAPVTDDPLKRAVRLTREAAFAWASLLHGPAVVTIAQ